LSAAVPVDHATTWVVTATTKQNGQAWTGGVVGDFILYRDGVAESKTVVETPDGTYTFTVTAVNDDEVWGVQLYDIANSRAVILKDTDLYKSNLEEQTAISST